MVAIVADGELGGVPIGLSFPQLEINKPIVRLQKKKLLDFNIVTLVVPPDQRLAFA